MPIYLVKRKLIRTSCWCPMDVTCWDCCWQQAMHNGEHAVSHLVICIVVFYNARKLQFGFFKVFSAMVVMQQSCSCFTSVASHQFVSSHV
jgi:hypothetical protein